MVKALAGAAPMISVYEIRLHRSDGALSIVMKMMAAGEAGAKHQALNMLVGGISDAHIWCGDDLIASIYAPDLFGALNRAAYQVLKLPRRLG
jgi:hypothetical protein